MLAVDDEFDKGESSEWTINESADHVKSLMTTKRVSGERPRKESSDHEKSLRTTRGACKPMRWHVSDAMNPLGWNIIMNAVSHSSRQF
jgi:hypothetical protein